MRLTGLKLMLCECPEEGKNTLKFINNGRAFKPANFPVFSCMEKASNKACVGCSLIPSPALIMAASICLAKQCGAPEALWRMTTISTFMLRMLLTVSSNVSPFAAEELETVKFTTSADKRFSASSKEILVLVEFS